MKGQLNYICRDDKAARIIDSTGNIRSSELVSNKQLNRITEDWENDWWKGTRNGQTSHMILSFPKGTSIDDVTGIITDLCEEKFNTGDRRFKYVAAIHDDQEHHPHAHIVLNRRASDKTLFNMRPNTEYSYEGFREAMVAHAERRGIFLDGTSRFERGITDRQPTRTEQRAAQKEGRAPEQRPREGADLKYAKEQIALARIGYEAMAVVAANADCDRLERAYIEVASTIENYEGEFEMPELSQDDYERFDQYTSLLSESLEKTQSMLETKNPVERVPLETRLTTTMAAFTALNPNANYAKSLHNSPEGNSIYMHQQEDLARWDLPHGGRVEDIAERYGLNADATVARLQEGASNQYLENMWIQDDIKRLAKANNFDIEDPAERSEAVSQLTNAYQELREELVASHRLRPVAELEADYVEVDGRPQITKAEEESLRYQMRNTDVPNDREGRDALYTRFEDLTRRGRSHAIAASNLWDEHNDSAWGRRPEGYLTEDEREREGPMDRSRDPNSLEDFEQRSGQRYSLSTDGDEHRNIVRLVKERLSEEEYDRFRQGDLRAVSGVTTNTIFARQLMAEVEQFERHEGYEFSEEAQERIYENHKELTNEVEQTRDHGRGR